MASRSRCLRIISRTLASSLLLSMLSMLPVLAQVEQDSTQIHGKEVRRQKLTLECRYYDELPDSYGWALYTRTYTLHIADLGRLGVHADNFKYQDIHAENFGYYAWSNNTWHKFAGFDENTYWLDEPERMTVGEIPDRKWGDAAIVLPRARRGITRVTQEMVWDYGEVSCIGGFPCRRADLGAARWQPPKDRMQCRQLPYRAPPRRLGF